MYQNPKKTCYKVRIHPLFWQRGFPYGRIPRCGCRRCHAQPAPLREAAARSTAWGGRRPHGAACFLWAGCGRPSRPWAAMVPCPDGLNRHVVPTSSGTSRCILARTAEGGDCGGAEVRGRDALVCAAARAGALSTAEGHGWVPGFHIGAGPAVLTGCGDVVLLRGCPWVRKSPGGDGWWSGFGCCEGLASRAVEAEISVANRERSRGCK